MYQMIDKKKYEIYQPLLIASTLALGMLIGFQLKDMPGSTGIQVVKKNQSAQTLMEVMGIIDKNYYKSFEPNGLLEEAIYELVEGLDDYSSYVPSRFRDSHDLYSKGSYIGIGVETVTIGPDLVISSVIDGSPASKSKLKEGARILEVDGHEFNITSWNVDSLSNYLSRRDRDTIRLKIQHVLEDTSTFISIKPSSIALRNISDVYHLSHETGYIRISRFGEGAYKDFMESLEILLTGNELENLVIDVRGNPGGFLQEVCKIISQILPEKTEFLKTVDKDGRKKSYSSTGKPFFTVENIVVLIDHNSASASEILAGVLQDLERATIVGQPSFGKGLVQEQFDLSDGGLLRLSISRYQLPSGRMIHSEGLSQDTIHSAENRMKIENQNGKIVPDIIIDADSSLLRNQLFIDAYLQIRQDVSIRTMSKNDLLDRKLVDDTRTILINREIAKMLYSDENIRQDLIFHDPFVERALSVFENDMGTINSSNKASNE
jgi:carboxyl-terminal processing protease